MLWWHRSHSQPRERTLSPETAVINPNPGAMVGYPATVDINADGVLDFVAAFTSMGDNVDVPGGGRIRTPAASWISAVSGRDGAQLWQRTVQDVWKHYATSSDSTERYNALVHLALDHTQSPPHLVVAHDGNLLRWNVGTGEDARLPMPLSFEPALAPLLTDLASEGMALFVKGSDGYNEPAALHALRLADGTNLWSAQFLLPMQTDTKREIQRWLTLVDLDGNGQKEIALARGSWPGPTGRFVELVVLSSTTGRPRWRALLPGASETPVRIVEGPDLDKNGTNELFVAWLASGSSAEGPLVKAAAFSGTDGRALWTWQHPHSGRMIHPDPSGQLVWWELGPDGWPLLGVPVIYAHGGQHATYFLSASTGNWLTSCRKSPTLAPAI